MNIVIQRVSHAQVRCGKATHSEIDKGLVLLVGFGHEDDESLVSRMVKKIITLRIFDDEKGKMNVSVLDVAGEILLIPNFTLVADISKGNRPSFDSSLAPKKAGALFEQFITCLKASNVKVQSGIFGAHMAIDICNDGPVTFVLDSKG
ncbi:MAG: D-tyrosyl-tRNA(Tyr) deacylase [Candidatus Omnitrophica bacterium]|nr:D-tyrosyl-tRNA(Tyr) deacylase [Candidatus Omnitrophota bacterium]